MDGAFFSVWVAMATLVLGLVAAVAGAAWRFGRVEKAVSNLEEAVKVLQEDVKRILERLPPAA